MRLPRFSLFLSAILTVAILWPARALDRARDFTVDLFGRFFPVLVDARAFRDLFHTHEPLAYAGPGDRTIEPALAHKQKHESGLSRLGTVRHL